jgi:hypothetical protein
MTTFETINGYVIHKKNEVGRKWHVSPGVWCKATLCGYAGIKKCAITRAGRNEFCSKCLKKALQTEALTRV